MKIEKGKLYYNNQLECVIKASIDIDDKDGIHSDKIAVHCSTKDDWDYVVSQGYDLCKKHIITSDICFGLYTNKWAQLHVYEGAGYHVITIDQFKEFYPPNEEQDSYALGAIVQNNEPKNKETFNPQPYYDNSKGSLYKVATERGWSSYIFDVVKRLERGGKKDPLRQEIEKSIDVLKIWLNELD